VDFPQQDLSAHNAQLLELMLANREIVARGHSRAEKVSYVYEVGYLAIKVVADDIFTNHDSRKAFHHGIRSFEAIAWLTHSAPQRCDMFAVHNAYKRISILSPDELIGYLDETYQGFAAELPRTAQVITESAKRFFPSVTQYAAYGAALTRQFALDSTSQ